MVWHYTVRAQIALRRGEHAVDDEAVWMCQAELARAGPQFGMDWLMWSVALLAERQDRPWR